MMTQPNSDTPRRSCSRRDDPETAPVEQAAASHIVLDNDFSQGEIDPGDDGVALMHATAAHEFHHAIEFGYDAGEPMQWYSEATATWMETVTYPDFQAATGYVETLFDYPELCLGVQGDADPTDGDQKYGEWLFLQSLVDAHDPQLVTHLWEQIGVADDWVPLDNVLTVYGDTRVDAVRRFRLQNLVRDYAWTPDVRHLDGLAGQDDRQRGAVDTRWRRGPAARRQLLRRQRTSRGISIRGRRSGAGALVRGDQRPDRIGVLRARQPRGQCHAASSLPT